MNKTHNARGAGRKPKPYAKVRKVIPVDLLPHIERMIERYEKRIQQKK